MAKFDQNTIVNYNMPIYWGAENREQFEYHISEASKLVRSFHFADNMFVWERCNSMFRDQKFLDIWEENIESPSDKGIVWRRYILATLAAHCVYLEGDFVECGCYEGTGPKIIIDYVREEFESKKFWLYDLFEYDEEMPHEPMPNIGPQLFGKVKERFSEYDNVLIFKGEIPYVFEQGLPESIAFLHIDLNQANAEIASLEALFDRVVPGGVIIFDDYEYFYLRAQKYAEDAWLAKKGYLIVPLPTSQGFLIKR